jgi:hypothetical protein
MACLTALVTGTFFRRYYRPTNIGIRYIGARFSSVVVECKYRRQAIESDDHVWKNVLGDRAKGERRIERWAEMGQPEGIDSGLAGQFGGFIEGHVASVGSARGIGRVAKHRFTYQQVSAGDELADGWGWPCVGDVGDAEPPAFGAKDFRRLDQVATDLDALPSLQILPPLDGYAERARSFRDEARASMQVESVHQDRDAVGTRGTPSCQFASRKAFTRSQFVADEPIWENRGNDPLASDNLPEPGRAVDVNWLDTFGIRECQKDADESAHVVGVVMADANSIDGPQSPTKRPEGNLGPFSTVD